MVACGADQGNQHTLQPKFEFQAEVYLLVGSVMLSVYDKFVKIP
jgi:hypothetical protein